MTEQRGHVSARNRTANLLAFLTLTCTWRRSILRREVRGRISPTILFRTTGAIYEKLTTDDSARVEDFHSVVIRHEFPDHKVMRVCCRIVHKRQCAPKGFGR
jgi:hypothetical protein